MVKFLLFPYSSALSKIVKRIDFKLSYEASKIMKFKIKKKKKKSLSTSNLIDIELVDSGWFASNLDPKGSMSRYLDNGMV